MWFLFAWLLIIVFAFLYFQTYSVALSDSFAKSKELNHEVTNQQGRISSARNAVLETKPHDEGLSRVAQELETKPHDESPSRVVRELETERDNAIERMILSTRIQADLLDTPVWFYFYPNLEDVIKRIPAIQPQTSPGKIQAIQPQTSLARKIVLATLIEQYAKSAHTIVAIYLLPLVLGLLGATAYIVRHTLDRLASNSYTPGWALRLPMRLSLGGLLGVISGIVAAPDQGELSAFNLGVVMFAFLMGYSVEFAFSLFDSAIERARAWTKSLAKPAE